MTLFGRGRRHRSDMVDLISSLEKERFAQAAHDSTEASSEVQAAVERRVEQSTPLRDVVAGVVRRQKEMDARR